MFLKFHPPSTRAWSSVNGRQTGECTLVLLASVAIPTSRFLVNKLTRRLSRLIRLQARISSKTRPVEIHKWLIGLKARGPSFKIRKHRIATAQLRIK